MTRGKQKNIDYWEKILKQPTPAFKRLFVAEKKYLQHLVGKNNRVLEIGCGNGRNIQSLIKKTKNIIGLDHDPVAVCETRKRLARWPKVKIVTGSAFRLPFRKDSFDFVIILDTLVNFGCHKARALREMKRVLKTNGKIIISVYSESALEERLKAYKKVGVPIERVIGGKVVFDRSIGDHYSEQFSRPELEKLSRQAGLAIIDFQKVGRLAYLASCLY